MNTTQRSPLHIFGAADRRHYRSIEGIDIHARRDRAEHVQLDVHLVHGSLIDEHWLMKLVMRLTNPGTAFVVTLEVSDVQLHAKGYGSLLRTEWCYTSTGLNAFHPNRAFLEAITPSGSILGNSLLFPQAVARL